MCKNLHKAIGSGKKVLIIFNDLAKAFDIVDRNLLRGILR